MKLKWTKLRAPNVCDDDYQFVPYMRYGHTASAIGDNVYIFGGRSDRDGACNNLFCFDTSMKLNVTVIFLHGAMCTGSLHMYSTVGSSYLTK